MRRLVLPVGLIVVSASCGGPAPETAAPTPAPQAVVADDSASAPADEKPRLDAAIERATIAMLRESPETVSALGLTEDKAGGPFADRLSDYSRSGSERTAMIMNALADDLSGIQRAGLTGSDVTTYDVALYAAVTLGAGASYGYGKFGAVPVMPYVVTQIDGAYAQIPDFLDSRHPIKTMQDARDYSARVAAFARSLDEETDAIRADALKGIVPPGFVIDGAVKQLSAMAKQKPSETIIVRSLATRLAAVPDADKSIVQEVTTLMTGFVNPALERQAAVLRGLRKNAPADAGVWRLPQGDALYKTALEAWNTTRMTPDEIHALGLAIVEKATADVATLLHGKGTAQAQMVALGKQKAQLYPNTDAGRAQLLADLNTQVVTMNVLTSQYFATLPKTPLEIKRVPPDIQDGAPGGYYNSGSLDGTRPGTYYINLRDTAEWPKFSLPTLTYHEGVPGHHFQISIAQESTALPLLRSALLNFSGYTEGWGLYSEQLADEMGVYAKDENGRIGYLQSVIFRAARLVVDTGIHAKRWTRDQAIDYMIRTTGRGKSEMTTEVDRYCVWPGQATAYMVGRESIVRLREQAKSALGDKFDIKAFHDVVLTNGVMPLSVLEKAVDDWVASKKG